MKKLAPVLTLLHLANALPTPRRIPDILERIKQQQQQPELQLTQDGASKDAASSDDVVSSYYDQRLDHFSKEDEGKYATFKQRYFYTSRYVRSSDTAKNNNNEAGNKKNALAFLCVGGEGPSMDASVLVDSVHCTGDMIGLADQLFREHDYDVHLFAVEHRYYGESFPSQEKEVGYLRGEVGEDELFEVDYTHLSSRQAVQDIVEFVKSAEASKHFLNLSQDSEKIWITFGGSYPGMLSAWSHLLHPDVIFAAVSSSAPVQARLDFQQYHEKVGSDLGDEFVGGSKLCETIVKEGHEQVVAALEGKTAESNGEGDSSEDGVDRVATLFNVCGGAESLRQRRNLEVFVGDGVIYVPAQGNDPSCEGEICNIKGLCNTIVNERKSNPDNSSMEILAHVRELQSYTCDNVDWESYLDYFKTPTKQNANDRSWMYQTCAEFGFYQTCNQDSHCPYGKGYHDVSRDLELCQEVFGIDPDDVKKNVDATLTYYGGWSLSPNTSEQVGPSRSSILENGTEDTLHGQKRIIFVTGDVDPWSELAVTGDRGNKDHPSINVKGASHHFWTHKMKDSDSDQIRAARQTIYETVSDWLGVSTHLVPSAGGETVVIDTE